MYETLTHKKAIQKYPIYSLQKGQWLELGLASACTEKSHHSEKHQKAQQPSNRKSTRGTAPSQNSWILWKISL